MKATSKKYILIGLTVIVSLFLLYWGINYLKGMNLFKPANFYYASFEKVDDLTVSSPITVNGYQVGLIKSINYDYQHNNITVEISLDKEMKVPHGSTISLSGSLLGSAQLQLQLGKGGGYYNVGDTIPATTQAGLMDKVQHDMMPQVTVMLPKVDSILGNVNNLTANPALNASLTRLDAITQQLAISSQELTALMKALNSSVPAIAQNANGAMGNVNALTSDLRTTTGNLNQLSYSLKNLPLDSTINRLNNTLANLQKLTNQLNDKNSSLGMLMNDKQLYNNANGAVASLQALLEDLKQNPKKYVTIKVF